MCDCQYCQEAREKQSKIDGLNFQIQQLDGLQGSYDTLRTNLTNLKTTFPMYMKSDRMDEMCTNIGNLDSDVLSVKELIKGRIQSKIEQLANLRDQANTKAEAYHTELAAEEEAKKQAILESGIQSSDMIQVPHKM